VSPRPLLSIVIPTLGNHEGLRRVLDRYEAQDVPLDSFEVLVVRDVADPDPGAVEAAVGRRPYRVRVLRGKAPGASSNRNAGWRAAEGPLVLFTDNDTLPVPRLVSEHLAWHRQQPADEIAVLGHVRWSPEVAVTPFMHWLDHGMQFDYPNIRGVDAGWGRFYSANVSVKRALVERVGGFDEERLPYLYEDLDFAYRASREGLRVLYNRRAVVEHLREMDLAYWRQRMARAAIAERALVGKHPDIEPYFFRMFSDAAARPPARGRGRHLIRLIPRRLPLLGKRVWRSADLYYRQQLAPPFLEAWADGLQDAPGVEGGAVAPYLLDRDAVGRPRPGR
jgi:GT2 family glycosyltransferase